MNRPDVEKYVTAANDALQDESYGSPLPFNVIQEMGAWIAELEQAVLDTAYALQANENETPYKCRHCGQTASHPEFINHAPGCIVARIENKKDGGE
ncbi:MAG: hypothetical protein GY833_16565 [Aestuariibacter sp.]|nr:hypothetical protein [Aestuariibacter sp.]